MSSHNSSGSASPSPTSESVLPPFLRLLPARRLLLCTSCDNCYTRGNYTSHLSRVHKIRRRQKRAIIEYLSKQDLVHRHEDVILPNNGELPIPGLSIHPGHQCCDCDLLTKDDDKIRRHCSRQQHSSRRVQLQTLFTRTGYIRYFVVTASGVRHTNSVPVASGSTPGSAPLSSLPAPAPAPSTASPSDQTEPAWTSISQRFRQAQDKQQERYAKITKPNHTSELTPWLRRTDFHVHLYDIDKADIPAVIELPKQGSEEDRELQLICASVSRVLHSIIQTLASDYNSETKKLNQVNAQLLNSFRRGETSQKPLSRHQNAATITKYISTFQKLCCYFFRVVWGEALQDDLFVVIPHQLHCAEAVQKEALKQSDAGDAGDDLGDSESVVEERQQALDQTLDALVFDFCLALVQHRLEDRTFDSVTISFCAVLAWDSKEGTWMKISNYSGFLSHLIYLSQVLILQHCHNLVEEGKASDLRDCIVEQRDRWLLNDCRGPVAELDGLRLLAQRINEATVNEAQIRWYRDGETLAYNDIVYRMQDLREEMAQGLASARRVFYEDLCLGMPGVPVYRVAKLVDNWDARKPGASFITDGRNEDELAGGAEWLLENLRRHPDLSSTVLHQNAAGEWCVRSDFADQYETSVQRFLEHLLCLVHKGSGQSSRRREFMGMRWCNVPFAKRNIFIHDGYVLFILTYHKMLNQTNASRWPVRFMLPAVGELLVQFLVMVPPFRRWLKEEVAIPKEVTEYLWAKGDSNQPWDGDKMTRVLLRESRYCHDHVLYCQWPLC